MERTSIKELVKWKDSSRRKPLVIEGARQVGKTWLVKEFARQNYKQLAYVNLDRSTDNWASVLRRGHVTRDLTLCKSHARTESKTCNYCHESFFHKSLSF
jgi:predicted AAA+ superfamily ATPase